MFYAAICTLACHNGGTCKLNPTTSTAECDCPVDTEGSYCQYKGTCVRTEACTQIAAVCPSNIHYSICTTPSYALNINVVTCHPSCQNGGICYSLYYSPRCYCAVKGTSGSYCQHKGKHNCVYSCQQQLNVESPHECIACFWHAVTCTPACQNGGTCHVNSSSAHCDCPSGHTGSYCQYSGMWMNVHLHYILYKII